MRRERTLAFESRGRLREPCITSPVFDSGPWSTVAGNSSSQASDVAGSRNERA
jgi:hypothetical protein